MSNKTMDKLAQTASEIRHLQGKLSKLKDERDELIRVAAKEGVHSIRRIAEEAELTHPMVMKIIRRS